MADCIHCEAGLPLTSGDANTHTLENGDFVFCTKGPNYCVICGDATPVVAIGLCRSCPTFYCAKHGDTKLSQCEECIYLDPFGDTYRFKLPDGTLVENINEVDEETAERLLSIYTRKVRSLENALRTARAKQAAARAVKVRRSETGASKLGVSLTRAQRAKAKLEVPKKLDLGALADALLRNPNAKALLEQLKKRQEQKGV